MGKPRIALIMLACFSSQAIAAPPINGFCIRNKSTETAVFAVDVADKYRELASLDQGEQLCTPAFEQPVNGFVSVFTHEDAIEGCSRLAAAGSLQVLLEYHDFDRCLWQVSP